MPVTVDVSDERFEPLIESTAYSVVSEAIANLAEHAHAREANVTVRATDGWLRIAVSDDGRGGAAPARARGSASRASRIAWRRSAAR